MTVVVVNAISVKEGGSLVVLRELLACMSTLRPQWCWKVVVNSAIAGPLPSCQTIEYLRFPGVDNSGVRTRLWYETGLPALVKSSNAAVLFSITNYLPSRRMPCRTLLLVQHAGHFSSVFQQLTEARLSAIARIGWRLKGRWVRSSTRSADAVVVQTEALAKQIAHETGIPCNRIRTVSHGAGQAMSGGVTASIPTPDSPFRVGYITKYGVQKNFAVLFNAIAMLKRNDVPVCLVLTLSEAEPENQAVLETARQYGIAENIENHGELPAPEIGRLYKSLHVFVFPSLCESFGFPIVEAMAFGIPLLVADVDSNVEVAGAGAQQFPPHDPEVLSRELVRLASDGDWFRQRAQASLKRGGDFSWGQAAAGTVALIDELTFERHEDAVPISEVRGQS